MKLARMPEWPCPYCGNTYWEQRIANGDPSIGTVICQSCHVMFNAVWVDGCWMGRFREYEYDGPLTEFVEMRAEELRENFYSQRLDIHDGGGNEVSCDRKQVR